MEMKINIAIDGPAGAGKSTIARNIAKALDIIYIDTGAMYRAFALFCRRNAIDPAAIPKAAIDNVNIEIKHISNEQHLFLNGMDVNDYIRDTETSELASAISVNPLVRQKLVKLQRMQAQKGSVVMDGRDIGTHVLKDAELKIYLTADPAVRAKRRYEQLKVLGHSADLKEIEAEIIIRDQRDMTREVSPLKKADDAIEIDTSDKGIDEVTSMILSIINRIKKEQEGD